MTRYSLLAVLIIGALMGLACSEDPCTPCTSGQALNPASAVSPEGHVAWGAFDIAVDIENETAEIIWDRSANLHVNVTNFISPPNCYDCVQIMNVHYDTNTLLFYIDFYMINPTLLTGYDVRAVITNPGGVKFMTNSDGITQIWGAPMQFKAINVDPERTFGSYEGHGNTLIFYLLPGENFQTMSYLVDASWPTNVEEPLIEQTFSEPVVPNGFSTTFVRAHVWDHQGDLVPDSIKVDLMTLGSSPNTPMYDDGLHNDFNPGDGVYGTEAFTTTAPYGAYPLNLTAMDGAGNFAWGQVAVILLEVTGGDNHDPIINGVTTDRTTANGGANEKIKITVDAMDPDGHALGYNFDASSGSFSGQNDNEVWWKPSNSNTGPQTITINVVDTEGGSASHQGTLWSTNKAVVNGSTQGMIPTGTLHSILPSTNLTMGTDFIHKVVYINTWGTWCPPCVAEMPALNAMYNKYKSNPGYIHIHNAVSDTENQVLNFVNSNGYSASYWTLDSGSSYFAKLNDFNNNSNGVPQHLIFDRDNRCRYASVGGVSSTAQMEAVIDQLL